MLRTAIKGKWLALLGVVILLAIAFIQLGRWQLGVAHDKARVDAVKSAGKRAAAEVTSVLTPHAPFPRDGSGRLVTASGTYGAEQVLVSGRVLDGTNGYWVLTPLTVTSTNAILPVVRGFTTSASAPTPPAGEVTVTTSLAPGEAPSTGSHPPGQLGSVDLARLVNDWPGEIYNAFGFAQDQRQAGVPIDFAPLDRIPPPLPDSGLNWRNAAYAVQWWVFAAFAFYLWLRMVAADRAPRPATRTPRTTDDQPQDQGQRTAPG